MNQSKDFIKFRQYIRSKNLKVNEQYLLELLFEYHDVEYGYAFPKFSDIMSAFNTTSKNRISTTIKKLEKKGLIKVDRTFTNNRYYVIGIEDFINTNRPKEKPKDSNGKPPIDGQAHIEEFEELSEDEAKIIELSKMSQKQAKSLLQLSKNQTSKVTEYVKYALSRGIKNVYAYVKKLINVDAYVTKCGANASQYKKPLTFITSCEGRNYSDEWYKETEEHLLGWA